MTYTELSNSVKKLQTRFDEGQTEWLKVEAKPGRAGRNSTEFQIHCCFRNVANALSRTSVSGLRCVYV